MDLGDGCGHVTETKRTVDVSLQCRASVDAVKRQCNGSQSATLQTRDIKLQSSEKIDNKNFS